MRFAPCAAFLCALALGACSDRTDDTRGYTRRDSGLDAAGAVDAGGTTDTGILPPRDGGPPPACVENARWIYLVDSDRTFLRFYPDELRFERLGTLSCTSASTPFSMAVDRDARAWVLYRNGHIYDVSTTDASCLDSGFEDGQEGFELFGMGFSANAASSSNETLYIAGGAASSVSSGRASFGSIDTNSLEVTSIGDVDAWPELTGTGSGELWGFYPDTSPPTVKRIEKSSGDAVASFDMPFEVDFAMAWAFAFWGGRFYVFIHTGEDDSTNVWRLDPTTGMTTEVIHDTGYSIVGAGVSTCAPVELI